MRGLRRRVQSNGGGLGLRVGPFVGAVQDLGIKDGPFTSVFIPPFNPGDAYLLESGDYLLLESGDKILLEA